VTDVIILAENTIQIAVGEKNRAGAALTNQRGFFSEMGAVRSHHRLGSGAAKAQFPGLSIDPAAAGTKLATQQHFPGDGDSLRQRFLPQSPIGGAKLLRHEFMITHRRSQKDVREFPLLTQQG